jgi:hypothetical protein
MVYVPAGIPFAPAEVMNCCGAFVHGAVTQNEPVPYTIDPVDPPTLPVDAPAPPVDAPPAALDVPPPAVDVPPPPVEVPPAAVDVPPTAPPVEVVALPPFDPLAPPAPPAFCWPLPPSSIPAAPLGETLSSRSSPVSAHETTTSANPNVTDSAWTAEKNDRVMLTSAIDSVQSTDQTCDRLEFSLIARRRRGVRQARRATKQEEASSARSRCLGS